MLHAGLAACIKSALMLRIMVMLVLVLVLEMVRVRSRISGRSMRRRSIDAEEDRDRVVI